MAPNKQSGLPEFWISWIAKALVGDQPCLYESWLKGHGSPDKVARSTDFAAWKATHTAMMFAERDRLKAEGWKVRVESYVKLTGRTAILAGKADLIAQKPGCRPLIIDCKGGTPRDSDEAQVSIYQTIVPIVWDSPAMQFEGRVVYQPPIPTVVIPPDKAHAIREALFSLLRRLGQTTPPEPAPSEGSCRFCDVASTSCPSRFQGSEPTVLTMEF